MERRVTMAADVPQCTTRGWLTGQHHAFARPAVTRPGMFIARRSQNGGLFSFRTGSVLPVGAAGSLPQCKILARPPALTRK